MNYHTQKEYIQSNLSSRHNELASRRQTRAATNSPVPTMTTSYSSSKSPMIQDLEGEENVPKMVFLVDTERQQQLLLLLLSLSLWRVGRNEGRGGIGWKRGRGRRGGVRRCCRPNQDVTIHVDTSLVSCQLSWAGPQFRGKNMEIVVVLLQQYTHGPLAANKND